MEKIILRHLRLQAEGLRLNFLFTNSSYLPTSGLQSYSLELTSLLVVYKTYTCDVVLTQMGITLFPMANIGKPVRDDDNLFEG